MAVFSFYYFIALVTVLFGFFFYSSGLEIPIPFGSLTINKGQDNETEIGLNRGINIGGYGATSGLSITAQKNGSITTETKGGALIDGTEYGAGSTFGVDKSKPFSLGTILNLGKNQTIKGGLGNEQGFITGLMNMLSSNSEGKQ